MNKTKIAVEIFDRRANDYQERFMDFDLYNDTFDLFCSHITKNSAELLDVACGPGNITKYLLKQKPDLKILGIDLALKMLELAQENNPSAEFKEMDCRNIDSLNKKFDAIMCGFCLPYLTKEEAIDLIRNSSELLKKGGLLYISTMEDDYEKSGLKKSSDGKDEMFIHYHQADYLQEALQNNGFSLIYTERKAFPEAETMDLVLIAKKFD
ncbi:class I SAM-dependent methyltransferase [Aurantibacillus circumpalustris]|uniref:class I SAM-dependent methyltransferase n=1 Tax=Aurantibacillus circumpalustris TaxID=3036359 RepID=UPI00295A5CA1|nr:class I SAM-dependent methyltransferase [Aurantibacillus circumpalustris]